MEPSLNVAQSIFDIVPPTNPTLVDAALLSAEEERKLIRALLVVRREVQRREWRDDPVKWAEERMGDFLWSAQKKILRALRKHRKVAVASCHEIGKSFIAAEAVAWWMDVHKAGDAFVVTSAPTAHQVRAILWKEIGRAHSRGNLPGRTNQTEWHMPVKHENGTVKEELVAFGRKPNDYEPAAFQGIHARNVLVVFDEGCGVASGPLWEAAASLAANDGSKLLVIGNPDDPQTEFGKICKPGSGWHVLHISAFDTPNLTGEQVPAKLKEVLIGRVYIEEKRAKWAKSWRWVDKDGNPSTPELGVRVVPPEGVKIDESAGPVWFSKVLGQFPVYSEAGGLIPVSWIRAAQERYRQAMEQGTLEAYESGANELGVDVGGGSDASTICHRKGQVYRIVHEDQNPDTMSTCGMMIAKLRELNATKAKIDEIGIGRGAKDRAVELKAPVAGVNVGMSPRNTDEFVNIRAEEYWGVREDFENGRILIDPADEDLAEELESIRYKRLSNGKIQIESKDDAKKRGVASPNKADALMLARAQAGRMPGDYGITI